MSLNKTPLKVSILDYVNFDYKDVKIEDLVLFSNSGDNAARDEIFARIDPVLQYLAAYYSSRFNNPYLEQEDLLHELYVATSRLLPIYDKSRGPFEHYFRGAISKIPNWAIARIMRTASITQIDNSIELTDFKSDQIVFGDSEFDIIGEWSKKIDTKRFFDKSMDFANRHFSKKELAILMLHISGIRATDIARELHLSRSDVFRAITKIRKQLRAFFEVSNN